MKRIDVHHHILPPGYVEAVGEDAIGAPAGYRCPKWTVSDSIAMMDQFEIDGAIVSISAPGIPLGDKSLARKVARLSNEFSARMTSDYPRRFGMLSTLPLPDIDASLAEIQYAFDVLHADGISLLSNYQNIYLGDPRYTPVMDELDRRKAIVSVHPNNCNYPSPIRGVPISVIEFPHDTTRTALSLAASGIPVRFPNIRFIFSHAGGTLPFLAHRIAIASPILDAECRENASQTLEFMKRFYFDTSLSANRTMIGALLTLVEPTQIMFGSDFPFAPMAMVTKSVEGLQGLDLEGTARKAIECNNARDLFPRFGTQ
jgi:predicted TIM-barrel fold metal-dependent hydrolase